MSSEIPIRRRCSGLCTVHCPPAHTLRPAGAVNPAGAFLAAQLAWLLAAIERVDAHLDDAGPQWAKDCPEANMQRRIGKAQLEAAEAMEELSLLTGENPRKGLHPEAREKMLAELGDTAVAALLGIQSQVKDTAVTWDVFLAALAKALGRVPQAGGEPPAVAGGRMPGKGVAYRLGAGTGWAADGKLPSGAVPVEGDPS